MGTENWRLICTKWEPIASVGVGDNKALRTEREREREREREAGAHRDKAQ